MTRDIWINAGTEEDPCMIKLCFWEVGDKWVCLADNEILDDIEEILKTGKPVGRKSKPSLTIIK